MYKLALICTFALALHGLACTRPSPLGRPQPSPDVSVTPSYQPTPTRVLDAANTSSEVEKKLLQIGKPSSEEAVWRALADRPLRLPQTAPGEPCPRTSVEAYISPSSGTGLGNGPIYVRLAQARPNQEPGTIPLLPDGANGVEGEEQRWKTLWLNHPDFRGPVLIRGRQIDGPNILRFVGSNRTRLPTEELQWWVDRPIATSLPSSTIIPRVFGCYAYQVDGLDFTKIIIFEIVTLPLAAAS